MIDNRDVMNNIEKIRMDRKMSIQSLTEGIISTRSYSRILSGETELSVEHLFKFLERMSIPIFEFGLYVTNNILIENINEVYFHEYVHVEKYEIAYTEFYPLIKDKKWKSHLALRTLPLAVKLCEYKLNKITKYEALFAMKNIIELNSIINGNVLSTDDVSAIYLYTQVCNEEAMNLISDFFLKVLFQKKVKVLTATVEMTTSQIQFIALISTLNKKELTHKDHINIARIVKLILTYQKKAKTAFMDFRIFSVLYKYTKKMDTPNHQIIFHYIASMASALDNALLEDVIIPLDDTDINIYIEQFRNQAFLEQSMYEELMNSEIL